MGQGSLFGGWEAAELTLRIKIGYAQRAGQISIETADENGRRLTAHSVKWLKPRDLLDLPQLVKEVATAFQYGTPEDVAAMLQSGVKVHLPPLPAGS